MSKDKGFGGWMEIFRGGRVVDSQGREHDGDAMIGKAVETFSADEHEPPVVIGHPAADAPAYGWVAGLKESNQGGVKRLLAKFSDISPEFAQLVKDGRYKKRSAAFYKDGRLRHLGFLGAVPPAIKGLPNVAFGEEADEASVFEFSDYSLGVIGSLFSALREWIIEQQGVDAANRVIPSYDIDTLNTEAATSGEDAAAAAPGFDDGEGDGGTKKTTEVDMAEEKQFSEADVKAAEDAAASKAKEEGKKEAAREFAEAQNKKSLAEFRERNWPKSGDGRLPPALIDAGVMEFLESLDCQDELEFAEGGDKKSRSQWFMDFLEGLPAAAVFSEVAKRGDEGIDGGDADEIAKKAREFQESEAAAGRTVSASEAVAAVLKK